MKMPSVPFMVGSAAGCLAYGLFAHSQPFDMLMGWLLSFVLAAFLTKLGVLK